MSNDREKLLKIMSSLESDYRAGKISAEKYSYFRSKYEDKLTSLDAQEATMRIRSMQGKPSINTTKRTKRPVKNNKKQKEDLVQKYIINPKKDDAQYNNKNNSSMQGGTFKLLVILFLVIGFTAGIAYGVLNFDSNPISDTTAVAMVQDTAFPEVIKLSNNTNLNTNASKTTTNTSSQSTTTTTVDTTTQTSTSTSDSSSDSGSSRSSSSSSDSGSSRDSGGSSSRNSTG